MSSLFLKIVKYFYRPNSSIMDANGENNLKIAKMCGNCGKVEKSELRDLTEQLPSDKKQSTFFRIESVKFFAVYVLK